MHAVLCHHAAGSKGVPRARKTKGVLTKGKDISNNHQMQKGRDGAPRSMQNFSAGPPSTAARASGARVQINPQRQKRSDSHSNEVPTPSPERLYVSRSLWGMCPPPWQPDTAFQAGQPAKDWQMGRELVLFRAQSPAPSPKQEDLIMSETYRPLCWEARGWTRE